MKDYKNYTCESADDFISRHRSPLLSVKDYKELMDNFFPCPNCYPLYTRNQARVIARTDSGRLTRCMFFWNGKKPVFASFGMDITASVVEWKYDEKHPSNGFSLLGGCDYGVMLALGRNFDD